MPLTPETLTRHELNGLHVRVADAPNPDLVGIEGRVVAETQGTLSVASDSRVRQVPKEGSTFEFALTDEPAGVEKAPGTASKLASETAGVQSGQSGAVSEPRSEGCQASSDCTSEGHSEAHRTSSDGSEGVAYVTVDGARLLSRPELRTENAGEPTWQQD
ncbi:ribonuclease P protein component 1 [Halorussus gelatinilyticus]|uniref:Ribonuclease P protein component 1 n=1 Tax=Halorussus gelatinilyticus TaxID=2937524 RepID=A0A8U0ILE1_9EURY|nr:ribonuclease P protein component 1 [Halorussus gelatinilyticus]UPW01034.1 ribonuclease P protein component 1 [Halorussus gelatinilyticus]